MSTRPAPPWVYGLAAATRINTLDPMVKKLGVDGVAREFARIPYRFAGERHRITDMQGARRRRFAACADAAAAIAAAAIVTGRRGRLCIEAPPSMPTYSHVRVIIDGEVYDPYEAYRADVPASCEWLVPIDDLVYGAALDSVTLELQRAVSGV